MTSAVVDDKTGETKSAEVLPPSSFRIETMIRQNSTKIASVAENVVLPINKRSFKRKDEPVQEVIDLEAQASTTHKVKAPVRKFPIFIITISIVQTLIFIFGDGEVWLALCYDPFRRHELWRFFTEMLVHKSLGHLLGNVVFQLILGLLLEIIHHWKRIGTIYMSGVLGGAFAVTVLDPKQYSLGASAGVYGLTMAHLATIILNWDQMDKKFCRLFWLLGYITLDVGWSIYSQVHLHIDSKISHAGHFGGAVAGFIAAVFVLRNFEKLVWEKQFQKILSVVTVLIFLGVIIVNVAFPSYYLPSEFNFNYYESFIRYALTQIYNTPEGEQVKEACLAEEECAFIYKQLFNATEPV